MEFDTSVFEGRTRFPSTAWEMLTRIGRNDASPAEMEALAAAYWRPVYRFIRAVWKKPVEDAKDLTQQFFAEVFDPGFVKRADPARGNFRKFVLASLRHFLSNQERAGRTARRGGGRPVLSLDAAPCADLEELAEPGIDPEEAFNRAWAAEILGKAIGQLEGDYVAAGKSVWFRTFQEWHLSPDPDADFTLKNLAEKLGITEFDVRNYLTACRRDLRRLCMVLVQQTVSDPAELDAEMTLLFWRKP